MPYHNIEQVFSRKHERVAALLSVHNVIGIISVTLPVYIASSALPGLLRTLLLLVGIGLGYAITIDIDGMPVYERLLWRLRALAAPLLSGRRVLSPADLPGMQVRTAPRVLAAGGAIRIARRRQPLPGAAAHSSGRVRRLTTGMQNPPAIGNSAGNMPVMDER